MFIAVLQYLLFVYASQIISSSGKTVFLYDFDLDTS